VLTLPPKERACLLLKEVFDYSLEEIAELVDSTVGVKAALNRGRTKLAASSPARSARIGEIFELGTLEGTRQMGGSWAVPSQCRRRVATMARESSSWDSKSVHHVPIIGFGRI
jgi:hypothetical protein